VTDKSVRTIEQWQERGIFLPHADQCVLATCDALKPCCVRPLPGDPVDLHDVDIIFCNYLLDVLPASIVRRKGKEPEQLTVRTRLLDEPKVVAQYTPLSLAELQAAAASGDSDERRQLLPLLPVLELETKFEPLAEDALPFLSETLEWGEGLDRILFNHGAIAALDALLDILDENGLIIISDYGPTRRDDVPGHASLQRFGGSAAQGINFPLLEFYAEKRALKLVEPPGDGEKPIHSRILAKKITAKVQEIFGSRFSREAYEHRQFPREQARQHQAAGRKNEALEAYKIALSIDPQNWSLIGEAAEFVALQLHDFNVGLEMVRSAIERNPWYSAWLWNIMGDCLFCLERYADAHEAYLQAKRIDAKDARTQLNISYTLAHQGDIESALEAIACGLAADVQGVYRSRLLEKQEQILMAASSRWLSNQERMAQRVTRFQ
jgi:tetratricopeptide (TPR) repeat protein